MTQTSSPTAPPTHPPHQNSRLNIRKPQSAAKPSNEGTAQETGERKGEGEEEEEDDYMSMTITDPSTSSTTGTTKETYTARRLRLQRESEARAHQPSKAALAAAATAARNTALATALPSTSKGAQMMAKLGFKPGSTLGRGGVTAAANGGKGDDEKIAPQSTTQSTRGLVEPLMVEIKEDRGGIGMDTEKKRKVREEAERMAGAEKKLKADEGGFRERVGREREERRLEGLVRGAMKVLEGLEEPVEEEEEGGRAEAESMGQSGRKKKRRKDVNVLYRGLVREREEMERERRGRYDMLQSLSRDAGYQDPEEDAQERRGLGREEEDVEEEDEELDAFWALESKEKMERLVRELREKYWYCFWCKYRYETEQMDGCPGLEEDDHD